MDAAIKTSRPFNILVAEDNEINQRVIKIVLSKAGHTFEFASDGVEAVKKLSEKPYDLILMDCQMPNLDGLEATAQIRSLEATQRAPRIPIVALTANAMKGDREKCIAAGMDDFLAKPFKSEEIRQKILQWAERGGANEK